MSRWDIFRERADDPLAPHTPQQTSRNSSKDETHFGRASAQYPKGLEGDRAERSEAKMSQCDIFRERADDPLAPNTPQQTSRNSSKDETHFGRASAQYPKGLECDRAERSEAKMSQCDIFRERADDPLAPNTPQSA